jgi:hypothetical protein
VPVRVEILDSEFQEGCNWAVSDPEGGRQGGHTGPDGSARTAADRHFSAVAADNAAGKVAAMMWVECELVLVPACGWDQGQDSVQDRTLDPSHTLVPVTVQFQV